MSTSSAYEALCAGDIRTRHAILRCALDAESDLVSNDPLRGAIVQDYIDEYLEQEALGLHRLGDYLRSLGLDAPDIDGLTPEALGRVIGVAAADHALADIALAEDDFDERMYSNDSYLDELALRLASGGTQADDGRGAL